MGFCVELVGELGLFNEVLRPTFQGVSGVPLVSVVREKAPIFGVRLKEQTKKDPERDPISQI